jgi:hypothetical protein
MVIRSVIVETAHGVGRFGRDEAGVVEAARERGIPVVEGSAKMVQRGRLELAPETLVAGTIPMVHAALARLKVPVPEPDDYPAELEHHLHRRVWRTTLGDPDAEGCFVKSVKLKRLPGFVMDGRYSDYLHSGGMSRKTPVWASSPVRWVTEWRCYVADGKLLGTHHYDGRPDVAPDEDVVRQAISEWTSAPRGYVLDFGVLDTGETALVEANHGYSVGNYGIPPSSYLDLLAAFWCGYLEKFRV